jgi:glycine betaine/proline transport system ATP-binding protein
MKDGRVVQIGTPEDILTNPADDYVMDFTRNVNRLRVLSAQSVMVSPLALMSARGGPRVALRQMEEQGISSIFVIDRNQHLQGLLTLEDAIKASEQGVKDVVQFANTEFMATHPDTPLEELLPVAAVSKWPIAVVAENGLLQGIIPRAAVLAALVGTNHNGSMEVYQKEIQAS